MTQIQYTEQFKAKEKRLAKHRVDSAVQMLREHGIRQDALQFSKNQLEALSSTIYETLYSNPVDAFVYLPINSEVADGMTEYSYRMRSKLGAAAVVADGATDRPLVDVDLSKTTADIYEFGSGYTYTIGDSARSGAILDFNYVQQKASYAAEDIARAHNGFALLGGSNVTNGPAGVTGFFNNATVIAAIPTLTDADWTTITGVNAYTSLVEIIQQVNSGSDGVHSATDLILSTRVWNASQGLLLNSAAGSQTVIAALRQNFPEITLHKSQSLANRGESGAGYDRCVAYERNSANVEYVASVVYDESAAIPSGFRWTIHSRGRAAGTIIRRPLSMVYADIQMA